MISATVVGNLGKDAEMRQAGNDNVCSFSIASSTKAKGEEKTDWVRCSLWGKRGEALHKHLTKGKKVIAVGTLSTREYQGKTYLELRVDQLEFGGSAGQQGQQSGKPTETPDPRQGEETGEIPF